MNRHFYFIAIFFTALAFITGLTNNLLFMWLRGQAVTIPFFSRWLVASYSIGLIAAMLQLKYFHHKKYWASFSAGTLYTLAFLWYCLTILTIVINQRLSDMYNASYLTILIACLLYALSLLLSDARKKRWLSVAGVWSLLVVIILLTIFTCLNRTHIGYVKFRLSKASQLVSASSNLVFIFFAINYIFEYRAASTLRSVATSQKFLNAVTLIIAIAALVPLVDYGWQLCGEIKNKMTAGSNQPPQRSELAEPFEARFFVGHSGDTVRYRLMKPLNYDLKKKYPLVACLHHGGAHGSDNSIQIDGAGAAQFLSLYTNRIKYPAFIFVPQCPKNLGWQDIDAPVFETIDWLETVFPVNTKKIYVTGVSGGGFGSWDFIGARPTMFAAAIPVCGAGDTSIAQAIVNIPVWAFQGEKDDLVPAKLQWEMISAIRNAGGHPRYTELAGAGHNIWDEVSQTPGLLDWLFAQERK